MTPLTPEQVQLLAAQPDSPPVLVDPESGRRYVLLRAEVYERVKAVLGEVFEPLDAYPAIDRAFAEGWGGPEMDDYDRYEELRK
jgi:hypothetical protein